MCEEHLTEVAPAYVPAAPAASPPPATGAGDEVLREIRAMSPLAASTAVSPAFHPLEGTTVIEALELIATQIDPDLGFRLLVRTVEGLQLPLTEEQYTRYETLAGRYHYSDDHLLFSVDHLVQRT
ncbi:hypothetical protein [Streptomyces virginiae]|uniref:hypothetical protein n=1 Tax=Streptomyces virginiae TaxID=1961 RepID=UPI003452489E